MNVIRSTVKVTQCQAEAVVVGVYSDMPLQGAAAELDEAAGGALRQLLDRKELAGKPYEMATLWSLPGVAAPLVLAVGLGERAKFDAKMAFRCAAAASLRLSARQRGKVAFYLASDWSEQSAQAGLAGAVTGCRGQDLYRAEKKRFPFAEISWAGADDALQTGSILGESINLTRHLVNEPPQEIYPESFAERATEVAGQCGIECEVWDEGRLESERAGSLLAVAKGSIRPPRLVSLRHGAAYGGPPRLAIVGKGVTFDSGGLSLKPSDSMKTMKGDMAGAATMLGAMRAIALLKLPIHVLGLAGLVENMPSGSAMKLGDVLHARNGRTIEVQNTDAEGRLVLADVLDVACDMGAERIVDLATLTGACVVALGNDVAGLMTNNQPWCDMVLGAAADCGEAMWQLPMFPDYRDDIRSEVADIRNTGEGRWGGAIAAAKFLEEFVGKTPWAHLDIAGPAFAERSKPWLDGGGTGVFVRTLVELARRLATA